MAGMVICRDCAFVRHIIQNENAPEVWYNWFCGKRTLPEAVDPVSGKKGYRTSNDLGAVIVSDTPFEYARKINQDGNCKMFKPRIDFVVSKE